MKFHRYTITDAYRPGWETTASTAAGALAAARDLDTPRVHYQKTPDHEAEYLPLITGPRNGLSLCKPS